MTGPRLRLTSAALARGSLTAVCCVVCLCACVCLPPELHEIEHCYYRGHSYSASRYLSLSTCGGGFSGFIHEHGTTWLLEPAHAHLPQQQLRAHARAHTMARRQKRNTDNPATNTTTGGDSAEDAEAEAEDADLHTSHLHLLFRSEDVVMPVFACTVGLNAAESEQLNLTGSLPAGAAQRADGPQNRAGLHTMGAHAEHDHAGHDHAHASAGPKRAATSSAYSTWLAAEAQAKKISSKSRSRLPSLHRGQQQSAAGDDSPHSGMEFSVVDAIEDPFDASAPAKQNPYAEHGFGYSPSSSSSSSSSLTHPFARSMRSEAASGATFKYVELLVTNDNKRYLERGDSTQTQTASIVAMIKATYEATTSFSPLLTVVLIGQITWIVSDPYTTKQGECSACLTNNGVSVAQLLSSWNSWRSNSVNVAPYAHDTGHLFSGFNFEVPTLGYAGVGVMCSVPSSGGIETMATAGATDFYNSVIAAHEMGHNLGMNHDSTANTCAQSGYIMNAVLAPPTPTVFSTCSITYEQNWIAASHITCLNNVPTTQYGAPVCGNGFVEVGEACDGGSGVPSRDPCCNMTSCAFKSGARCSALSGCCDAASCQIVPASTQKVCRAAAGACDLPEMCTGTSATCPADGGYAAGTACTSSYGPGACFLNSCFSYLQQCRTAGANFIGAPYDTCSGQSDLNQGAYCNTLWCSSTPGQCTYFKQQGVVIKMSDGVPCPDSNGDLTQQCLAGSCVDPNTVSSAPLTHTNEHTGRGANRLRTHAISDSYLCSLVLFASCFAAQRELLLESDWLDYVHRLRSAAVSKHFVHREGNQQCQTHTLATIRTLNANKKEQRH